MTAFFDSGVWGKASQIRIAAAEPIMVTGNALANGVGGRAMTYELGGLLVPMGQASGYVSGGVNTFVTEPSDTPKPLWSPFTDGAAIAQVQANSNSAADWSKLQFGLAELYFEAQIALNRLVGESREEGFATFSSANTLAPAANGFVTLDMVAADGKGAALLALLEALGLEGGKAFGTMVSGRLPIDAIDDLAALEALAFARPAYAMTNAGAVTSPDGDALQTTGPALAGLDGTGLTVGVLSDSFDNSAIVIDYAADIASGDLPADVLIIDDSVTGSDEGRAMAQLIFDIAPGVDLAFHTAFGGQAAFAQGILDLAAAGADIIVDDVLYFAEPFFQDGIIAQAVDTVDAMGISYLSSAGNQGDGSYESAFDNSGVTETLDGFSYTLHDFDPGAGVDTRLSVSQSGSVTYVLQWDESFFSVDGVTGATNDLDIIAVIAGTTTVIASSTINNLGGDPIEIFSLNVTGIIEIIIGRFGTAGIDPGLLKLVAIGGSATINEFATDSSTSFGHNNAEGALSVGAAFWAQTPEFGQTPPLLENFSSKGGTPILFDTAGNRLATPEIRDNVDFTSTDGGDTTFFGTDVDSNGFPNFFGTSAAAPTAAAVIALLKQAVPTATNEQIETALESTAIDILNRSNGDSIGVGYDVTSGAGLIQADLALAALQALVASSTVTTVLDEGFETDGNGTRYTTSTPEFSDGSGDYFTRTDGSNIGSFVSVTGFGGSFYFAAQDIDGEGAASTQTLNFTGLDISGLTGLSFSIDIAEDEASDGNQDWDADTALIVEFQIDGGGFQNLLAFEAVGGTNTEPAQDTDFDGVGDGTTLTDIFQTFSAAIAGTGSSLDIRITFAKLDAGDEDVAIDNIQVTGTAASADPSDLVINEVHFDPATDISGDANGDGTRSASQDEFIEIVNTGAGPLDISGFTLSDDDGGAFVFPAGTVLAAGQAAVLFGGGTPAGNVGDGQPNSNFGGALVFVDDGTIGSGLANGGDLVELRDEGGNLIDSVGYGSAGSVTGGSDQSVTRDPDLTGNFADHTGAAGSGGALFSPGTRVDGSNFTGGTPTPTPQFSINDVSVAEGDSGTTTLQFTVTLSEPAPAGGATVDYATSDDTASAGSDYTAIGVTTLSFAEGETSKTIDVTVIGDTLFEADETLVVTLSNPTGTNVTIADGTGIGTILNDDAALPQGPAEVFINEIHYDDAGADEGEGIEIAGPAGTDLSGWTLVLYNGNGGGSYNTTALSGIIPDQDDGYGTIEFAIAGIQNGNPDGIALVDAGGNVVQFLSYEGTFTATNGPAAGLTSEDIGVAEIGVPEGTSLQLGGTGFVYDDFTWQASQNETFGGVNTGQDFAGPGVNGALFIDDAQVTEGDSGTATLTFNVFRVGGSTGAVSADYAVAFGGGFTDADASDLSGATSGTVSFADGETFKTITIDVAGDTVGEPNEFFDVVLSNPTGGVSINDSTAVGTIVNDDPLNLTIGAIQGAGHTSVFVGNEVSTSGVVTAVASNGFYLQDGGDGDSATSDGIFVFTGSAPTVVVGNAIDITGTVSEFQPGGDPANLTITQLSNPTSIVVTDPAAALPAAVVIGPNGITPPTEVIEDDGFTSFDPASDGIDFWESLEGMLVTIENPVAVDTTNGFDELFTVASDGAGNLTATNVSAEGLLVIKGGDGGLGEFDAGAGSDFNPERVLLDEGIFNGSTFSIPDVGPGTVLNDVTGVVSYGFENYRVLPTADVTVAQASTNVSEGTSLVPGAVNQLAIATYNVLNFDINEADGDTDIADGRLTSIARDIGISLGAPDIVALQEVQDDSGSANDGTTSAALTLQAISDEIFAETGIRYSVLDNPFVDDGQNGGQPGGNIRVAFLYRDDRVDLDPASVTTITDGIGNIDAAFGGSRAPLVADFIFNGETVTVVNNHFTSKIGSDSTFSANQPPTNAGALSRAAQAAAVNGFVDTLLTADANANVVVLGDLNEFQFEEPLEVLTGELDFNGSTVSPGAGSPVLSNLAYELAENDRYSVIFQGNAQLLDHILVSANLTSGAQIDAVHINSPLNSATARSSDHDPLLAIFNVGFQTITGTPSDETLIGNDGNDIILGEGGNDTILGGAGDDLIVGGDGDDTIIAGEGDDALNGGDGNDLIFGGPGNDRLAGGSGNDQIFGDAGNDQLQGQAGNDLLIGGEGNDDLRGGDDNDRLFGDQGTDTLDGGNGDDFLSGGAERDYLFGGTGNDDLAGDGGADILDGGTGNDRLTGGSESDFFILHANQTAADADIVIDFEAGVDRIGLVGSGGKVIEFQQSGVDTQIFADGILVARMLNAQAADVVARTLFDSPPASSTVVPAAVTTASIAPLNAPVVLAEMGYEMDEAFQFVGTLDAMGLAPGIGTTGYSQTKVPMAALFGEHEPTPEPHGPVDMSVLDEGGNPWLRSMIDLDPLL